MIYTTHDITNLNKETFRRDEIWFTEKDNYGVSELFSLSDYKIDNTKVRNDATYNKDVSYTHLDVYKRQAFKVPICVLCSSTILVIDVSEINTATRKNTIGNT